MKYKSALFLVIVILGISTALWPSRRHKSTEYFPAYGFTVWRPAGWHTYHYARAGTVWLTPDAGDASTTGGVRVLFRAGVCSESPGIVDYFESEIGRLKTLYELETIAIVSTTQVVEIGDQTYTWIVIELPTSAPVSASEINQQNLPRILAKSSMQRVAIYAMEASGGQWLPGYIYFGRSDKQNEQAREIMHSVRLVCR